MVGGEPRGDHTSDRHGHVRTHREELAVGVEEPVGGRRPALVAAGEHRVVLDRGGCDLAVAVALEHAGERSLEAA
jgi:hypothetical protein